MGHRTAVTLTVLLALGAAACDGGDDTAGATPATTVADATTAAPATTVAETTTTSSTTTSTSTTTTSTTTTSTTTTTTTTTTTPEQAEEALKAQIAADYERAYLEGYAFLEMPTLDNLEATAATFFVAGSPAYQSYVDFVGELVASGDRVVPNDPDLLSVTVDNVQLVGTPPYTEAIVTACEVSNRRRVTAAENSPTGQEIPAVASGQLDVFRVDEPVQLTDHGWLNYRSPRS